MKETIRYETTGTCCSDIIFCIDDGIVSGVRFIGGCPGGLEALAKSIEGMSREKVIDMFNGVTCGSKGTSCADQLVVALVETLTGGSNGSE